MLAYYGFLGAFAFGLLGVALSIAFDAGRAFAVRGLDQGQAWRFWIALAVAAMCGLAALYFAYLMGVPQ